MGFIKKDGFSLWIAAAIPFFGLILLVLFGTSAWDTDYFEYIGWNVSQGRRLYVDIWDCKGPVLYLIYAVGQWLWPNGHIAGQIVMFFFWELSVWLFYRLFKKEALAAWAGRGALGFVFLAMSLCYFVRIGAQETLGVFFALLSLNLLAKSVRWWRFLLLGGIVGLALMTKATLVAFAGALLVEWTVQFLRTKDFHEFVIRLGFSALGFTISIVTIVLLTCPTAVWEMFDASFLYNALERNNVCPESWLILWLIRARDILCGRWDWFVNEGWYLPLFAWLVFICLRYRPSKSMGFPSSCYLKVWIVLEVVLNLNGKKFHDHYCVVLCAPLAMMLMTSNMWRWNSRIRHFTIFVCIVGGLLAIEKSAHFHLSYLRRQAVGREVEKRVSKALRRSILAHERVATCGRGMLPRLLLRVRALNRNRYCSWGYWVYRCSAERRIEILQDFLAACQASDNQWLFSEVPIDKLISEYGSECPELKASLAEYQFAYRLDETGVVIYRREGNK